MQPSRTKGTFFKRRRSPALLQGYSNLCAAYCNHEQNVHLKNITVSRIFIFFSFVLFAADRQSYGATLGFLWVAIDLLVLCPSMCYPYILCHMGHLQTTAHLLGTLNQPRAELYKVNLEILLKVGRVTTALPLRGNLEMLCNRKQLPEPYGDLYCSLAVLLIFCQIALSNYKYIFFFSLENYSGQLQNHIPVQ